MLPALMTTFGMFGAAAPVARGGGFKKPRMRGDAPFDPERLDYEDGLIEEAEDRGAVIIPREARLPPPARVGDMDSRIAEALALDLAILHTSDYLNTEIARLLKLADDNEALEVILYTVLALDV